MKHTIDGSTPEEVNRSLNRRAQEMAREHKKVMAGVENAVAIYSKLYAGFLRGVYTNPDEELTPMLKAALIAAFQDILTKANPLVRVISWDTDTDVIMLGVGNFKMKCYLKDLNENEQEAVCELEL